MTAHPMTSTERDLPEDKLRDMIELLGDDTFVGLTRTATFSVPFLRAAFTELLRSRDALASIRAERDAAVAASVADVVAERERQKAVEGWTPEHDDEHKDGELARAAACYALGTPVRHKWPWGAEWWKPGDRRRNLVKAGALILAEIDRLDRAARAIAGEQTNAE